MKSLSSMYTPFQIRYLQEIAKKMGTETCGATARECDICPIHLHKSLTTSDQAEELGCYTEDEHACLSILKLCINYKSFIEKHNRNLE